jgi:hypothetical protein
MIRCAPLLVLVLLALVGCQDTVRPAALPVISPDDPASLQRAFTAAIASGAARLVIPPGIYRVPGTTARSHHLLIDGARDLTIEGTGAVLVFTARDQHGLSLRNCRNTVLRGLRLERATPTCSQGVVERLEEDGRFCVVRIDPGYPQDIDDQRWFPTFWCNVFTPDRGRWLAHYRGLTPTVMQRLAPDLVRVQMSTTPAQVPVELKPGTPLAWRGVVFDDLGARDCEDCTFDSITVAGGAGMCFHERGGGGNRWTGCSVVRAATPPDATQAPLLASTADGFHSSGATRGPLVERCSFTALDDDAIAIHGSYAMAVESSGTRLVAWRFRWEENALYGKPGDTLRFYDPRGVLAGEAVVTAVRKLEGYQPKTLPDASFRVFQEPKEAVFLEFTCDRPVAATLNWLVSNPACAGSGYVIRDCVIRDCFARGILPKGDRGLIENNLIERTARGGIELLPELFHWSENDYSTAVVIRGNTLREVNSNRQTGDLRHPGALTVFAFRAGAYVPAPGGHRDILIAGNTFEDNHGPNLMITSADGVRVEGNRFVRPLGAATGLGADRGVDPHALVWLGCTGVSFAGNRIEQPGAAMQRPLAAGLGAARPASAADGFIAVR